MKNSIMLLCILLITSTLNAQTTRWAIDIGDASDITCPNAICTDNNNVYLAGFYRTNLTVCDSSLPTVLQLSMPQQNCNMFISKYDSTGNCRWTVPGIAISTHPPAVPGFSSIKYDGAGSLYVAGGFTDTMIYEQDTVCSTSCIAGHCNVAYVMKLDTNGNVQWSKSFGGPVTSTQTISNMVLANGKVYVAGFFQDTIEMDGVILAGPNAYSYNGFIAEINSSGHCVWIKNVSGAGHQLALDDIATDGQDLYIMGYFIDSLVFPTRTIYQPTYYSSYIAKYDSGGNFRWVYGGLSQITRYLVYPDIACDRAGHIYVTGLVLDSTRIGSTSIVAQSPAKANCIARLDSSGVLDWVFNPGFKAGYYGGTFTSPDKSGFYYYTTYQDTAHIGSSTFIATGLGDFLLARYDSSGNPVWAKSYGGTKHENAEGIVSNNGVIYYTGFTYSNYLVDGFPIVNHNYMDVLLGRMFDPTTYTPAAVSNMEVLVQQTNMYPNPTNGIVTLNSDAISAQVKVYSLTGQLLIEQTRNANTFTLNLSELPAGIYLLKDISLSRTTTFKVIKL